MSTPVKLPPFILFTGGSALVVLVLALLSYAALRSRAEQERELAVESGKARAQADRDSVKAIRDYEQQSAVRRQEIARSQLAKARASWAKAQDRLQNAPGEPDLVPHLNAAFQGYNQYLDVFPDDADVRLERARVHEIRRNPDRALEDLEKAAALKPELAPGLKDQIARLRKELGR